LLTQGRAASHPNARAGREGKGVGGKGIPAPPSLFRRRNFSYFALRNAPPFIN